MKLYKCIECAPEEESLFNKPPEMYSHVPNQVSPFGMVAADSDPEMMAPCRVLMELISTVCIESLYVVKKSNSLESQ